MERTDNLNIKRFRTLVSPQDIKNNLPLNDHIWKFGATDKEGKVVLTPDGKVAASPMRLFQLITEGSPPESTGNNGARMVAWGQQLKLTQIAEVVSYIISKVPEDFKDIPKP